MSGSEDALRHAYTVASTWNEWATGLVTAGVIVELIALFIFGKKMPRNEKIAVAIGSMLVVVGVAGEWVYGGRASYAAAQLQRLSDQKIAEAEARAASAELHAAILGVNLNGLDRYVRDRTTAINNELSALEAAEERAKTALAKIEPLTAKEVALSSAIASDKKRLSSDETLLAQQEEKQEGNRKRLDEIQTEAREYETENMDRALVLDQKHAATTLAPYMDVPIYISIHDDPETLRFGNQIKYLIRAATGREPKYLHDSEFNVPGVQIFFEFSFNTKKPPTSAEIEAASAQVEHQRAAAMAVCRELQFSRVSDAVASSALVDEPNDILLYWDRALPKNAILVRVGPLSRPVIDRRRAELYGREKLFDIEKNLEKTFTNLDESFGRKGVCEPGLIDLPRFPFSLQ